MGIKTLESELSHLSDEEYLIARSKQKRSSNPAAAKAWMITAQFMFPDNAAIKYEAYVLEKDSENAAQAAKMLKELIYHFAKATNIKAKQADSSVREKVESELDFIVSSLQRDGDGIGVEGSNGGIHDDSALLVSIFECFDRDTQQKVMMESAEKKAGSDVQEYGALLLRAFERFPELIPMNGARFLNTVVAKIKKNAASTTTPQGELNNRLRDPLLPFLIMEMCPRLVTVSQLKLESALLLDLISLIVDCAAAHVRELVTAHEPGAGGGGGRFGRSAGKPWRTIMPFMEEIGLRMGWELTEDVTDLNSDDLFQRVLSFKHKHQIKRDDRKLEQFFTMTMLGFLKSVSDYELASLKLRRRRSSAAAAGDADGSALQPHHHSSSSSEDDTILVEAFVAPGESGGRGSHHHQSKRRKTTEDDKLPLVTHGDAGDLKSDLISSFLMMQEYFGLIRQEPEVFKRFQQAPYLSTLLASFFPDIYLYWGSFRDALQVLRSLPSNAGTYVHLLNTLVHFQCMFVCSMVRENILCCRVSSFPVPPPHPHGHHSILPRRSCHGVSFHPSHQINSYGSIYATIAGRTTSCRHSLT